MPSTLVSSNLTKRELACKDGTSYPEAWLHTRAVVLAAEFEAIRELVGGPLVVRSAYRTPAYNAKVGGAIKSQHLQGRALDLSVPLVQRLRRGATARLWAAASERAAHPSTRLRGLGFYPWGVHIDIRPSASLVTWDYR